MPLSYQKFINSWIKCYAFYGNFNVQFQTWQGNVIKLWYFAQKFSKIDLDSRAQNYVPLGALNAAHAHNNTIVLIAMSNIYLHTCISYFVIQKDFWKWGRYIQIVKFFKIMTNSNYTTLYSTTVVRVKISSSYI